ncbi:MAG: hypothetical protein II881_06630 [Oscillospiraceae bacterium]|nr:hypothetical protein [Oscillospiraceae bacterium]
MTKVQIYTDGNPRNARIEICRRSLLPCGQNRSGMATGAVGVRRAQNE